MSKKNNSEVIHLMARRKFWSGAVVAACGVVAQRGEYDTTRFSRRSGTCCPACQRIYRDNAKRKG